MSDKYEIAKRPLHPEGDLCPHCRSDDIVEDTIGNPVTRIAFDVFCNNCSGVWVTVREVKYYKKE